MISIRNLIYLSLITLITTGCSPKSSSACCTPGSPKPQLASISIIDRNGMTETVSSPERIKMYKNVNFLSSQPFEKVLRIYERDLAGNIRSYITTYHSNGQPKQFLQVVNSRAYGTYQEWHENGCRKLDSTVVGGEADVTPGAMDTWLFDSLAQAWDEEGFLAANINYNKGVLEGKTVYFHANGNVWKKIQYTNNEMEGVFETFLENGDLLQSTGYEQGVKSGRATRNWHTGLIAAEELYNNDFLQSGSYFNMLGHIISEVHEGNGFRAVFGKESVSEIQEYKRGVQEGVVKVFASDKLPIRTYHVKNGMKQGEEVEYFDQPHLRHLAKLSISWYEGKIQGTTKTWYDNGVLESQRDMSNNKKNGIATAWFRDGSLMLIEEYEQDKIMKAQYFKIGERIPISVIRNGEGVATLYDSDGNFIRKINYRNGIPLG